MLENTRNRFFNPSELLLGKPLGRSVGEGWYNRSVSAFRFSHKIQIRFGDLDTQWHVNNARYLTYLEDARYAYVTALGLFDGKSFHDLPLIVAKVTIEYLAPMHAGKEISVNTRVSRLGNKSLTFEFEIADHTAGRLAARAETILVAYDYQAQQSMPLPEKWRQEISAFEGIPARAAEA